MSGLKHDDSMVASLLLEGMGQSVIGLDRDWRVQYWNPASERLYGCSAAEVMGRKIKDLGIIPGAERPAGQPKPAEGLLDGLGAGREWVGEFWMQHRAGREFPVFAMVSPVRAMPGTSVTVVVVSKDITERKHREAALRRLSAMIESSGDAIIGLDTQGLVTSWNTGAVEILGWQAQEAVGQSYTCWSPPPPRRTAAQSRQPVRTWPRVFRQGREARWRHKDGTGRRGVVDDLPGVR